MSSSESDASLSAPNAPAGWYPDPSSGEQRYGDGHTWTDIVQIAHRPLSGPAVAGFILSIVALVSASIGSYVVVVVLLLAFIFSGIGMNATVNGKSGRGLGIAGLIISIFALLASIGVTTMHLKP